jgi:uncharacterized spore protein YtfJ
MAATDAPNVDVESALSKLDAVKDVLTVKRVFGEAMEVDGVAVIPVAKVKGGGGAGGGGGTDPSTQSVGQGQGVGFGLEAKPVGVFVVREGDVQWRPAVDVMRIVLGGQIVAIVALLVLRKIFGR